MAKLEAVVTKMSVSHVSGSFFFSDPFSTTADIFKLQSVVIKGLQYLNNNADVIEGIIGWGAGAFSPTRYPLSLTPEKSAETGFKDKPFITQGLLPTFKGIPSTTD